MPYDHDGNFYEDDDPPDYGSGLPGDMGSTPDLNDGVVGNSPSREDYQQSVQQFLNNTAQRHGASVEASDVTRMMEYYDSAQRGQTTQQQITDFNNAIDAQYARRGASTNDRNYDSQGPAYNQTTNTLRPGYDPRGAAPPASPVISSWAGTSNTSTTNPTNGLFPDWYRDLLERQMAQAAADRAQNQQRGDTLYNTLLGRATQSLNVRRPGTGPNVTTANPTGAPTASTRPVPIDPGMAGGNMPDPNAPRAASPILTAEANERLLDDLVTNGILNQGSGFNRNFGIGKTPEAVIAEMNRIRPGGWTNASIPAGYLGAPGITPPPPGTAPAAGAPDNTYANSIDDSNAAIWNQADAFSANQERSRRNYMSDLAEEAGPNANLRGEQRMSSERAGINSGAFEAELMSRELTSRRDEIQSALTQMGGMLSGDQTRQLQAELAQLDAAVREAGLNLQSSLGNQDLALRSQLGNRGMDMDWQRALMQNNQFLQNNALNWWDTEQRWRYENQYPRG